MELKKANLHMDQIKCQANAQFTLEEDKNISERNPDAVSILMEKGRILLNEVHAGKDSVAIKGKMLYEVLYISDEGKGRIYKVEGEIPLEEKIRVEGMEALDNPQVKVTVEDIKSGLINSRKINIRSLLNICVEAKEIRDEEVLLEVMGQENIEVKKEPYVQSVMVMDQKDIFRIKEELELPATLPPIQEVLWKDLNLEKWEVRNLEDKIGLQGEVSLFILYEAEGEERTIKAYETKVLFSGNIDCPGSNGCMIADITPTVNNWNVNIRQDYDGEERVIEIEMVLEVPIQLYENREMEIITDVYGTSGNVLTEYSDGCGKKYREKYQTKVKAGNTIKVSADGGKILQVCHIEAHPMIETTKKEGDTLEVEGVVSVGILYMTDKEDSVYEMMKREIPFSFIYENGGLNDESQWKVLALIEQCDGIILEEDKLEVKLVIALEILLADCWKTSWIKNIRLEPYSKEQLEETMGIMVYIPGKKESLWEIGKRYGVSIESIKNMNQLTKTEVERGQKILLVKEVS